MMRPARGFSLQMLRVAVLLFKGTSALAVPKSNFKVQADIDRRYRFEERARCDVKARAQNSGYNTRQLLNIYRERYSLREVCMECVCMARSFKHPEPSA
jgi:hypothetical protein